MPQGGQIAIAGPNALAGPSQSVPGGTVAKSQHNVPRFLLKIYEIVNDPTNESLIKWSEAGDSFYIYDHERFAKEILGKWFKHQNFSSFVRQLNLYGFRKISALQQGLVRADNDHETIQFAHPYFHQGQPDLLNLIQRKRPPTNAAHAESSIIGLSTSSISQDSQGQAEAVDVNAIFEGINAIRRQQQVITSDLTALKQSNDALWKEAIAARERHAKHEDTINRILKFLAGLVGRAVEHEPGTPPHADGSKIPPRRLLIGDGRATVKEHTDAWSDGDMHSDGGSRANSPFSTASERFTTVETPDDVATPMVKEIVPSIPNAPSLSPVQPTMTAQSAPGQDITWQTLQALSSQSQLPQAIQSFKSAQPYQFSLDPQVVPQGGIVPAGSQQQQLSWPSASWSAPILADPLAVNQVAASQNGITSHPTDLAENTERLNRLYRDKAEIDRDVDTMQTNLHSLIRGLGFDPATGSFPAAQPGGGNPPTIAQDGTDFSFDQWMNEFDEGSAGLGKDEMDFSAFLDIPPFEEQQPSGPAAPVPNATASSPAGYKRKMDLVEPLESLPDDAPSTKRKR